VKMQVSCKFSLITSEGPQVITLTKFFQRNNSLEDLRSIFCRNLASRYYERPDHPNPRVITKMEFTWVDIPKAEPETPLT